MTWIDILDIFKGLLTPVIACFVAYIAYQQHKTNRDKLRLDLFDKRYKIFHGLMSLLGIIGPQGDVTDEQLSQFIRTTADAPFLFDKSISSYLDTVYKKSLDLQYLEKQMKQSGVSERVADKRDEVFSWLTGQHAVARAKFEKYMQF